MFPLGSNLTQFTMVNLVVKCLVVRLVMYVFDVRENALGSRRPQEVEPAVSGERTTNANIWQQAASKAKRQLRNGRFDCHGVGCVAERDSCSRMHLGKSVRKGNTC